MALNLHAARNDRHEPHQTVIKELSRKLGERGDKTGGIVH
jgi:hypothetical protein